MNGPKKQHSQWDLSKIELNVDTNTDPSGNNYDAAENRHSYLFSTIRHQSHYFSNIDALSANGYNYLKYAKYSEVRRTENNQTPRFTVTHLSYNTDLRSSLDCALLRLPRYHSTLVDVTFELHAGDIMALMYASEWEMNCLIRLLSGTKINRGKIGGEIAINGHKLNQRELKKRIGFIPSSFELPMDLTVGQYLTVSSKFYPPKSQEYLMDGMIHQYCTTLALSQFKECRINKLAPPERIRLRIMAELLKEPSILILSNILNSLDIYDVAFIVDCLREWAIKSKRIVILSIAPPTIDILNMCSKSMLLSLGRVIYFGCPTKMCNYFSSINYNCPSYKNPCDFYVDLSTYDYLSNESESESSMRIGHLVAEWQRKYQLPALKPLDTLPKTIATANFFQSIAALFRRMSYEFINRPQTFVIVPLISSIVSLLVSLSFISLSIEKRAGASERLGLVETIAFYSTVPINMLMILYIFHHRKSSSWECKAQLYVPLSYGITKILFDCPIVFISSILYALPIYFVTSFDPSSITVSGIASFVILICLHFFYLYTISLLFAHIFKSPFIGSILSVCLNLAFYAISGLPIHALDEDLPLDAIRLLSPHFWLEYALLQQVFMGTPLPIFSKNKTHELIIGCERAKVLAKKIKELPIYTVLPCSKIRGSSILYFHAFPPQLMNKPLKELGSMNFFTLGFVIYNMLIFILLICFIAAFKCNRYKNLQRYHNSINK